MQVLYLITVFAICIYTGQAVREVNHRGRKYLIFDNERTNRIDAAATCARYFDGKGELVTVDDGSENLFINRKFKGESFWLGGKLDEDKGWIWTSKCPVNDGYTNWDTDELDSKHDAEQCMAMLWNRENGEWENADCSRHLNFACEERDMRCAYHKGRKYLIFEDDKSRTDWINAAGVCLWKFGPNNRGELVTINDEEENEFIENELQDKDVWLGGKLYQDGELKWRNRCRIRDGFTNWDTTDISDNNEDNICVAMQSWSNNNGDWKEFHCSREFNFACEEKDEKRCVYYQGKRYVIYETKADWFTAQENCAQEFGGSGQLVTIDDENENYFISTEVDGDAWLGGNDDEDGVWKWRSGCPRSIGVRSSDPEITNTGFTFWDQGEPNNTGDNEHCLSLQRWHPFLSSRWNVKSCLNKNGYACEEQAKSTCDKR